MKYPTLLALLLLSCNTVHTMDQPRTKRPRVAQVQDPAQPPSGEEQLQSLVPSSQVTLIRNTQGRAECPIESCDYSSRDATAVRRHIRTNHTGETPYECPYCGERFTVQHYLPRHISSQHPDQEYVPPQRTRRAPAQIVKADASFADNQPPTPKRARKTTKTREEILERATIGWTCYGLDEEPSWNEI